MGPAQASGGAVKESRMTAEEVPSGVTERFGSQGPAVMLSLPRQSVATLEFAGSSTATAESASTISAKRILPSLVQVSQLAEDFLSGVRFTDLPPVAGRR